MRLGIFIAVLFVGVVLGFSLIGLRQPGGVAEAPRTMPKGGQSSHPPSAEAAASRPGQDQFSPTTLPAPASPNRVGRTDGEPSESAEAGHQAYVENRTDELMHLGTQSDPASLDIILSELNNPDPQIRKAALDATVQFRSRDAIPRLMDAAAQTDDLREKAAIADAIDFLKLPSITEALDQAGQTPTNATAAGPNP